MARDYINPQTGRLTRKDPITGVPVISPLDPEMLEMTGRAMAAISDEAEEEARRYLSDKKYAQAFVDQIILEEHRIPIKTVINATVKSGMNESSTEILFQSNELHPKKYKASCFSSYGSFYEPPDGGCEIEEVQ
jgi:hypothetical protein